MTSDLRTRVEALRDELSHKKAGTRLDVETMLAAISRVLDADPDTPTPDAPVDDGLVERLADVLREIGGQIAWSYEDVARKVVVARPWQAEVER